MFAALSVMTFGEIFLTTFAMGLGLGAAFIVTALAIAILENVV